MKIYIDGQAVEAEAGMTVLQAARKAGITIPTLCYDENKPPQTSCYLCAVRIKGFPTLQPSCAARVHPDMEVESNSEEVIEARRTALELLFSDHAGRCVAPCAMACPSSLDIPAFLREMRQGKMEEALGVVYETLALPAILGRTCRGYCESACVRKKTDDPLAIKSMHGRIAELQLPDNIEKARANPPAANASKKVAIVGSGPAGLAAAFYLLREGIACDIYDAADKPGGLLLSDMDLDQKVVAQEIELILAMGANFKGGWALGKDGSVEDLQKQYDAVILAMGASKEDDKGKKQVDLDFLKSLGLPTAARGIQADRQTMATPQEGLFACGDIVMGSSNVVRCNASGRVAAKSVVQYLAGEAVTGEPKPVYFVGAESERVDLETLPPTPRVGTEEGVADTQMEAESERCLNCGCEKEHTCKLRQYGMEYAASPKRFKGESRGMTIDDEHPEIVYEAGKCILCGLCIETVREAGEEVGLSFVGRGFPTRVTVPLNRDLNEGLKTAARKCAEICPTAAFSLKGEWK